MKFLLDENVPNFFKNILKSANYSDIKRINDFGKGLKDREVFDIAVREKRTIITIDTDYYAFKNMKHYGIIRISGKLACSPEILLKVIDQIIKDQRFIFESFEDVLICITHQEFKVRYMKKGKYKEVTCKHKISK